MPTYEYLCGKCDHEFEREQRITEDPIKTCPKCKSRRAKRLISRTSFMLKGGGWYSDGYSSGGKGKGSDSSSDSSSGSAASDSSAASTGSDSSESSGTPDKSGSKKKKGKKAA